MKPDGSEEFPIVWFDGQGNGPHYHVCADAGQARVAVLRGWLERQILIGGVTPDERRVVERAIADMDGET